MIESVEFKNFKSLRDVRLRGLQQLNVIVGASGVGKTSVLRGIELLAKCLHGERLSFIFEGRWEGRKLVTLGRNGLKISSITSRGWRMSLAVGIDEQGDTAPEVDFTSPEGVPSSGAYLDATTQGLQYYTDPGPASEVLSDFSAQVFLQLEYGNLGNPSIATAKPLVKSDGVGLASALAFLAGGYRDRIESIESDLRKVIGMTGQIRTFPTEIEIEEIEVTNVNGISFPRVTRRMVPAHRFEVQVEGVGWVSSDLLSEGTLMTLGLLTVLHQPECPRIVLLDDIDKGLHPSGQAKLIAGLRSLLDAKPDVQIIGTSHSPYLLDQFQPEEVQVMTFTADGQVAAARLDTHPEWLEWKGSLQTGEFWSSVGEDWAAVGSAHGE